MKRALITGITGQDGSYLSELLLSKGYEVHGIIRRASTFNTERIDHIYEDIHQKDIRLILHYGDLADSEQLTNIIYNIKPDEIYHMGAQSHVRISFDLAEYTTNITGLGTLRILEAIRKSGIRARFYQASSSEMFGSSKPPQNEQTPFRPRSPYAAAKLYSYWTVVNYRDGYNIFGSNGILFNHESPRRGEIFVTRKITRGVARILAGRDKKLYLGNLDARRDWGYAPEYMEIAWRILQEDSCGDYVIGTGATHSIKDLLNAAFGYVNKDWRDYIEIDKRYFRPTEVEILQADITKARKQFKWEPKVSFEELVKIMIDADMRKAGLTPIGEGDKIISRKFPDRWWNGD